MIPNNRNMVQRIDKEINVIKNMRYLLGGYGLCSLEKMIPADVPVICVYGQVTDAVVNFLDNVMHKCCVIGVGETAIFLLERKIKVDFIIFSGDTRYEVFEQSEVWKATPLIVNAKIPAFIFEKHNGKVFFFASNNEIENFIVKKATTKGNVIYQYNRLMEVVTDSLKEQLIFLADFMGDSYTMLLEGKHDGNSTIEVFEKFLSLGCHNILEFKIQQYFKVAVDVEKIISWLIPFFDQDSRKSFADIYNNLIFEFQKTKEIVADSIQLYEQLYKLAEQDIVLKSELDMITNRLNENTASLEATEYVLYLLNISETIDFSMEEREKPNEIAGIALEALDRFQRLMYVLDRFIAEFPVINYKGELAEPGCSNESKEIKNILLIGGSSQYGVLPHFVEGLKQGFQKLGVATYRYIYDSKNNAKDYEKKWILGHNHFQNTVGYEYVLLMNGVFIDAERYDGIHKNYKSMYDNINSKILCMLVDHPVYHMKRIKRMFSTYALLLADNNWVKYAKCYLKDLPQPVFFPLGGLEQEDKKYSDFKNRANKIVFFGGISDISQMQEQIEHHKYADIIKRIVQILEYSPDMTIEEAVNRLEEENRSKYTIHAIVFHTDVFFKIDHYMRQLYRQKVLNIIIQSGLPIDIYGWKDAPYEEYSNVTLKDAVSFDEMIEICNNVRFVLNVQPWLKSGTQERVFNTMLCGAIAITDGTEYLREKTIDETNILIYDLAELDKLPAKIQYYMNHEEEAEQIAKSGYELAKLNHTWTSRAGELMELLKKGE